MDKPVSPQPAPLTIEELEVSLRILDNHDLVQAGFGDGAAATFRETVLLAIRETSEALLSPAVPPHWRTKLECQLQDLLGYLDLSDRIEIRPQGLPH